MTLRRSGYVLCASALLLGGCASFSPDLSPVGGFSPVQEQAQTHLRMDLRWARSDAEQGDIEQRVAALLAQPLDADKAVQLALLNNRGLQARFYDLGIAQADWVQATRLPNPGFSLGRLTRGHEVEREYGLHLNLARLLALPLSAPLHARRFAQTQAEVLMAVLTLAHDTRKAYVVAVSALETVRALQQVKVAAQASAELAQRLQQVGNINKLQLARQQLFLQDAALNLARAEQAQASTHEQLVRWLGLWGEQAQTLKERLPAQLPELPATPLEQIDIEQRAMSQRLDIKAARQAALQTAQNLGLTQSTRFINVLELGLLRSTSNEAPSQRGWEISVELPLFDGGGARLAKAQAVYAQSLHQAAFVAINARSEVRQAYTAYRSAYDIARFQLDEVLPLRKSMLQESGLRYNGMLIGVFELLAESREQIHSLNAALVAKRDFWLAQATLDQALLGRADLPGAIDAPSAMPAATSTPAAGH